MRNLSDLNIVLPYHLELGQFKFRRLLKLVLRAYNFASCLNFLCSLRAPSLVTLAIDLLPVRDFSAPRRPVPVHPWERVFEVIGQKWCDSPLSELRFSHHHSSVEAPLPMDYFRPLYIFANMTKFVSHIEPQLPTDLGIREMASAWPNLRTLQLLPPRVARRSVPTVGQVSLGGLAFLVQTYQNLTRLELEIDTRINVDPLPHTTTPNMLMHEIDVRRSPIEDARRVAAFLTRILPNLRTIKTQFAGVENSARRRSPESHHKQWLAVQGHLLHI
jgi:hypothetical protein